MADLREVDYCEPPVLFKPAAKISLEQNEGRAVVRRYKPQPPRRIHREPVGIGLLLEAEHLEHHLVVLKSRPERRVDSSDVSATTQAPRHARYFSSRICANDAPSLIQRLPGTKKREERGGRVRISAMVPLANKGAFPKPF